MAPWIIGGIGSRIIGSLSAAAFALTGPVLQGVMPYRLRSLGVAYAAVYIFLLGAVGGALLGSAIASSYDERVAIIVLAVPGALAGALLLARGATSIDDDLLEAVAVIREEEAERARQQASPETIPMLQLFHSALKNRELAESLGVEPLADGEG